MKSIIPPVSFYFVRHGQTDWNKNHELIFAKASAPLNNTGVKQAEAVGEKIKNLNVKNIYSSPLARATQTASIINKIINVNLLNHPGLHTSSYEEVIKTFTEILSEGHPDQVLVVSHSETYHILLSVLMAKTKDYNAKNCGLYWFKIDQNLNQWNVHTL